MQEGADLKSYLITIEKGEARKRILVIGVNGRVKHIYTLSVKGDLEDKHVISYHEKADRITSRLSARKDTEVVELSLEELLEEAVFATRKSISIAIFKKIREYIFKEV